MEIMVMIDEEYYDHVPVGEEYTMELSGIAGKLVVVKLAAESAELQVSVERKE